MDKPPENAQSVIAMSNHLTETGYAAIAQVDAYWDALRGSRLLPSRSDIDPRGIEQALEYAFILERIAPGVARHRIAGSHLNDLLGMEVRGMPLTAFFTAAARASVSDLLEDVAQRPAKCTLRLRSGAVGASPVLEGKMILLPLKSDLGDVSRILGCLVTKGPIGNAPRRFDIQGKQLAPILPGVAALPQDLSAEEPGVPTPAPAPARGFAETQQSFAPKGPQKGRPPYLRLVKTDE